MMICERNLVIEGKFVRLEEVQPKYFSYIVEWRNNPEFNKYLNQPYKLTIENQTKWYEEKYLEDMTQCLLVMISKKTDIPFGTAGWTDYNAEKKIIVSGRALVGDARYRGSIEWLESRICLGDYMYAELGVDFVYSHIVKQNRRMISINRKLGFLENVGEIVFPNYCAFNGLELKEYYRGKQDYFVVREKLLELLS